ncbi:MAG: phosphoglycerate kinase [Candidatus Omnitrophota bacterium]
MFFRSSVLSSKTKPRLVITRRFMMGLLSFVFLFNCLFPTTPGYTSDVPFLPPVGTIVPASPAFQPVLITGMTIHPENPLQFDFIVNTGDDKPKDAELQKDVQRLINYFFTALTVPDDQLWVNLSPYEKDRIVADGLSRTELGRDMLAQDYLLKQLTASMLYPERDLGSRFWKTVRAKIQQEYGKDTIPVETFNKVWIVPDRAVVHVNSRHVFVTDSHFRVLLEQDYVAREKGQDSVRQALANRPSESAEISGESAEIVRRIILPEIEKEVNQGKHFANLRQIFHSLILASWYKKNLKEGFLSLKYIDQNKITGIDSVDALLKDKIYRQYVEAFEKGVYSYIKEEYDPLSGQIVPRKYVSGGITAKIDVQEGPAKLEGIRNGESLRYRVSGQLPSLRSDEAMLAHRSDPYAWSFGMTFDNVPNNYWDGKNVFGCVDYNVKIDSDGTIKEENSARIKASLPMIVKTVLAGGSLILSSHLDDPHARVKAQLAETKKKFEKIREKSSRLERMKRRAGRLSEKHETKIRKYREILKEYDSKTEDQLKNEIQEQVFTQLSLGAVARDLQQRVNTELSKAGHEPIRVHFSNRWQTAQQALEEIGEDRQPGDIILLENSRFDKREMVLHKARTEASKKIKALIKKSAQDISSRQKTVMQGILNMVEADYSLRSDDLDRAKADIINLNIPETIVQEIVDILDSLRTPLTQHLDYQAERFYGADAVVFEGAAVMHRGYASTLAPDHLPAFIGPLVQKELTTLEDIKLNLETAVIGGKNVKSLKEKLIDLTPGLLKAPRLKHLLSMGQVGLVFLKAAGKASVRNIDLRIAEAEEKEARRKHYESLKKEYDSADSNVRGEIEEEFFQVRTAYQKAVEEYKTAERRYVDFAKNLIISNVASAQQIKAPRDMVVAKNLKNPKKIQIRVVSVDEEIGPEWDFLDIGPQTIEYYRRIILDSRYAFWNGPGGRNRRDRSRKFSQLSVGTVARATSSYYAALPALDDPFQDDEPIAQEILLGRKGSHEIVRAFAEAAQNGNTMVAGGGGTAGTVAGMGFDKQLTYVLTGGGSSLKYLAGQSLPALEALIQNSIPQTHYDYYRVQRMLQEGDILEKGTFAAIVHRGLLYLFDRIEEIMRDFDEQTGLSLTEEKIAHFKIIREKLQAIKNRLLPGKYRFQDGEEEEAAELYQAVTDILTDPEHPFEDLFAMASIRQERIPEIQENEDLLEKVQGTVEQINYFRRMVWDLYGNFTGTSELKLNADLNQLIRDVVNSLASGEKEREQQISEIFQNGTVIIDTDLAEVPGIIIVEERWRRILKEMFQNAIWASVAEDSQGNHVPVNQVRGNEDRQQTVHIRTRYDVSSGFIIEIEDEGVGMSNEDQEKSTHHLYSREMKIRRKKKSDELYRVLFGKQSGNGLPALRLSVQRMGGSLAIDSARGRGTKLTIKLPPTNHADQPALNRIPLTQGAIRPRNGHGKQNGNGTSSAHSDEAMLSRLSLPDQLAGQVLAFADLLASSEGGAFDRDRVLAYLSEKEYLKGDQDTILRLLETASPARLPKAVFSLADAHSKLRILQMFLDDVNSSIARGENPQVFLNGDIVDKDIRKKNLNKIHNLLERIHQNNLKRSAQVHFLWGNNEVEYVRNALEFNIELKEKDLKDLFPELSKAERKQAVNALMQWLSEKGFIVLRQTSSLKSKGRLRSRIALYFEERRSKSSEDILGVKPTAEQQGALDILHSIYKHAIKERENVLALAQFMLRHFQYIGQDDLGFLQAHTLSKKKTLRDITATTKRLSTLQDQVLNLFDNLTENGLTQSIRDTDALTILYEWHEEALGFTSDTSGVITGYLEDMELSSKVAVYQTVEANSKKFDELLQAVPVTGSVTGHLGLSSFYALGLRGFLIGIHNGKMRGYWQYGQDGFFWTWSSKKEIHRHRLAAVPNILQSMLDFLERTLVRDKKDESMLNGPKHTKGGIDLNPQAFDMTIEGEAGHVVLESFPLPETLTIDGLVPVIINVTPVTNLHQLLGLENTDEGSDYLVMRSTR